MKKTPVMTGLYAGTLSLYLGFGSASGAPVFSDTFNYTVTSAFIAEGGWTTWSNTGGSDAGSGLCWGQNIVLTYNHPTALSAGETITMDATLGRPWGGYLYGMRVILWDGADAGTEQEVAGGTYQGNAGGGAALPQLSYTVSPADITGGLDHVIFRYSHDGNWGETLDVSFAVDPPPAGWTWDNAAGGSWASSGDWTPAGPADGADQAALIHLLDITGDTTITLDGTYTIGNVWFADSSGADGNWILDAGTGGPLTLSAPVNGSPGIEVGNQTATVNAVLTGSEGLTKTGSGTLILGTANTYTGGTFIEDGTVGIADTGAIPSGTGAGDVTLDGTLDLADTSITLNGLSGSGTVTNSGTGTPTLTIGSDDADGLSFNGPINDGAGTTSLVKTGTGTQTIRGVQGLSGTIVVEGGTLVIDGGVGNAYNLLHNVAGLSVDPGSTVELNGGNMFVGGHGAPLDASRVLSADGGTLYFGTLADLRIGNVSLSNGATWTIDRGLAAWDVLLGDTTAGAASVTVANTGGNTTASLIDGLGGLHLQGVQDFNVEDVTGDAGDDLVVSLELSGPGNAGGAPGGINKLGSGTMRLQGPNSYTGDTVVGAGELVLEEFAVLRFIIGANGVNNKVTGAGSAYLDGDFDIDLTGADATNGNSWTLVDVASATYGPGFFLPGFDETADVHSYDDGIAVWTFTEATGELTVEVANDYDAWAVANGYWTPGDPDSGPTEDFDGDGVTNEDEWAFGLDPTDGTSVSPFTAILDPVAGTFTYTRRDPALTGLVYSYEWSTTLGAGSWTTVVPAVADVVVPIGATDNQSVTVDLTGAPGDPLSNPALFIRVEAVAP